MKIISYFTTCILFLIFITSCGSSRQMSSDIVNTWYGFLPCADCPGISYTFDLAKDGHYNLKMDYYDRPTSFTDEGKYTFKNGRVNLYSGDKITSRFQLENGKLYSLDADGQRIKSELAPFYILYKNDPSKAKMPEGFGKVDSSPIFKGTGNEPFWMVQIRNDSTIYFKGMVEGDQEFVVPVSNVRLSDDNQSIIYSGAQSVNSVEVHVINKPCQDDMSGQHFTATLEVSLSTQGKNMELKGCGQFFGQDRLNGIWRLETIDDKGVETLRTPTLAVYLPEGKIAGSTGCNRFFGSVDEVTDDAIHFDQTGVTKMACPEMSVEERYLNLLNQNDITWKIDQKGRLHLSSNTGNFVFSRTQEF